MRKFTFAVISALFLTSCATGPSSPTQTGYHALTNASGARLATMCEAFVADTEELADLLDLAALAYQADSGEGRCEYVAPNGVEVMVLADQDDHTERGVAVLADGWGVQVDTVVPISEGKEAKLGDWLLRRTAVLEDDYTDWLASLPAIDEPGLHAGIELGEVDDDPVDVDGTMYTPGGVVHAVGGTSAVTALVDGQLHRVGEGLTLTEYEYFGQAVDVAPDGSRAPALRLDVQIDGVTVAENIPAVGANILPIVAGHDSTVQIVATLPDGTAQHLNLTGPTTDELSAQL